MFSYLNGTPYILLIDDNQEDYEAVRRALEKAGVVTRPVWCNSGEQALGFLTLEKEKIDAGGNGRLPGIILLDLNMPGTDGFRTLQRIKQDKYFHIIPVIIFSTSADPHDVARCYQAGANSYVEKSVNFDKTAEAIRCIKAYWLDTALLPTQGATG